MRPGRAVPPELVGLRVGDELSSHQRVDPPRLHRPPLGRRQGVLEVRHVHQRRQRLDAGPVAQLPADRVEVEPAAEGVHPGLQHALAVQGAPQTHRAERVAVGQRFVGEVAGRLVGVEVDGVERDEAADRLLHDLHADAVRVKAFAAVEAERFPQADEPVEVPPRRAVNVVVVVGPADAHCVLPALLKPPGRVAPLPVFAFGGEEQVAGDAAADAGEAVSKKSVKVMERFRLGGVMTLAQAERLRCQKHLRQIRFRLAGPARPSVPLKDRPASLLRVEYEALPPCPARLAS